MAQVVDPGVSQAKFDREVAAYRDLEATYRKRGWLLFEAKFPEVFVAFAAILLLYSQLGFSYFPQTDAGQFVITIKAPSGTKLTVTEREVATLENLIKEVVRPDDLGILVDNIGVDNGFSAMVAVVEVNQDTGKVSVKHIVLANDSGPISNPDGLRNQIEGGALQGDLHRSDQPRRQACEQLLVIRNGASAMAVSIEFPNS